MSLYSPDAGAIPDGITSVALLSQRELSLQIPVNYVNLPGVALTPACFGHQRYEDQAAVRCFSNLLATGFRRIEIDVYWDASRLLWSLCPVELGSTGPVSGTSTTTSGTSLPVQTPLSSVTSLSSVIQSGGESSTAAAIISARQNDAGGASLSIPTAGVAGSTSSLPSISTTATLGIGNATAAIAITNATATSIAPSESPAQGTLITGGPYICTTSVTFELFADVLAGYLSSTETNLAATTRFLVMNIHAAAPASDPTASAYAPADDALPGDGSFLSSILASNNSAYMYTPDRLQAERANLNTSRSWFNVPAASRPDTAYFSVMEQDGLSMTPNGWPSESFVELQKGLRLFAGFGFIDPQMQGYNVSADASSIFPSGYLQAFDDVSISGSDGSVENGCFYNSQVQELAGINSSWAVASPANVASQALTEAANLTDCGISPMLNQTLQDVTAAEDYRPYQAFAHSTVWPWGPGEPRSTNNTGDDDDSSQQGRCAALNATVGTWQTVDCLQSHYAACRVSHQPYQWQISDGRWPYMSVDESCDDDGRFSAPRTALENTYLVATWRQHLLNQSSSSRSLARSYDGVNSLDEMLYVNFNSLDAATCWVIGQNTTCPYLPQRPNAQREVVVPTVAAVVVFVVVMLTVFIKCAANRQNSRRKRRRRDEGWDYEGVPS